MRAPPKQKRAPAKSALPKLPLLAAYHAAFLARILAAPFWFFEQRRWRVADNLDDESLWP